MIGKIIYAAVVIIGLIIMWTYAIIEYRRRCASEEYRALEEIYGCTAMSAESAKEFERRLSSFNYIGNKFLDKRRNAFLSAYRLGYIMAKRDLEKIYQKNS